MRNILFQIGSRMIFLMSFCMMVKVDVRAQTYIGKQKDIENILDNVQKFSQYVMAADYKKIAASYTADAKIFPGGRDIIAGREGIIDYWVLPEGVRTTHHRLMPEEIKVIGKEAYDYGYYEGTTRKADGSESSWRGKYVVIWRKEGGDWKMYLDIWNRAGD